MGKRRPAWDYQHYLRYLKEARGQGTGADYKPWIYIHDFPSRGVSARIPGGTTGRIHHLLSRQEEYYFYILDADPDVLDIREQFPLRLTETMEIARRLNVKHPWKGDFPFVMTTDFLVTRPDGLHARTIKCSDRLHADKRNGDQSIRTEQQPCFFGGRAFLRLADGNTLVPMINCIKLMVKVLTR
jgi:hypothetical protein